MARKRKPQAIHVASRFYWDRHNGNTYARAVATIYLRDGSTESVEVPAMNGGCDYAVQRIGDELEASGWMPKREHYPQTGGAEDAKYYFRERRIPFTTSEREITRYKEL